MKTSRRIFLKIAAFFVGMQALPFGRKYFSVGGNKEALASNQFSGTAPVGSKYNLGVDDDGTSRVYLAKNTSPEENMRRVISLMGGIQNYIGKDDIVVLKPNAQWWNQGMTNTDSMKAFIEMVLNIPDFVGEIIIAENHQIQDDNSRGWTTEKRNGRFNFNELIQFFNEKGCSNVTKYHWHNGGQCSTPLQHDACCGRIVSGPEDGDGYVWMTDSYYLSPAGRKCMTTYPVFTSKYSGITIDLKNGPWKEGKYLDRKIRFINFSALNHHGRYVGVTASVKNLMGVVDMTCGFPGNEPERCYNVHHIGVSKKIGWLKKDIYWRLGKIRNSHKLMIEEYFAKKFCYTGGALGVFMKDVRMPDLNIITAESVGWGHRTNPKKADRAQALAASTDPVALDLVAAEKILLPVTPKDKTDPEGASYHKLNNPSDKKGPFYKFLKQAYQQGIGNIEWQKIKLKEYDIT